MSRYGDLDEFGIFKNRVLTPSDVTTLYNNGNGLSLVPQITIAELQNQILAMNATINQQQQDIDYLYTIWEQVRDTIINWLTSRS